jgi:hypothetical protein
MKNDTSILQVIITIPLGFLKRSRKVEIFLAALHSNSFSPENSKISPVSAQPKLRVRFRMFLVSVTQNHAQNSAPKFRLLIPDRIREKFVSDF